MLVLSLPDRLTIRVPNRILATATLAVVGFMAMPKPPAAADPVPPLVRLSNEAPDREPARAPLRAGSSHIVTPGDSLWCIAAATLEQRGSVDPSSAEIARFWPRIYGANRDVIGDDPDLILPGQHLTLPPP